MSLSRARPSLPACRRLRLRIRAMAPDELGAVSALFARVAAARFTWRPPGFLTPADFARFAEDEETLVAEMNGGLLGGISIFRPENFIHSLYVAEEAQGLGIGAALLRAVLSTASGPLSLKCDCANARARRFYAAHGFREAGGGHDGMAAWVRLVRP